MRLNIVYFMLGLGLSLFSNVWAMPLSNDGNAMYKRAANAVYIKLKSTSQERVATPFLTAGLPYIFKNMPTMGFSQDVHVRTVVRTEPASLGWSIQFDIYADQEMQTLKGAGTIRHDNQINLSSLRVFDKTLQNGVYIGPHEDDNAQFEIRNGVIVVEEKLHEQLNSLSLNHGP